MQKAAKGRRLVRNRRTGLANDIADLIQADPLPARRPGHHHHLTGPGFGHQLIGTLHLEADRGDASLIAFNVGVETCQLLALGGILILMGFLRRTPNFLRHAYMANVAMMCAGFMLMGYQLTGLFIA